MLANRFVFVVLKRPCAQGGLVLTVTGGTAGQVKGTPPARAAGQHRGSETFVASGVHTSVHSGRLVSERRALHTDGRQHPRLFLASSLPFVDFSLPFLALSLPFEDFSLPFVDFSLPFLDLSLPFLDLSLPFRDVSLPFTAVPYPRRVSGQQ